MNRKKVFIYNLIKETENKIIRFKNSIKYPDNAPGYAELIYINPAKVEVYNKQWKRRDSGLIKAGDWDKKNNLKSIHEFKKIEACNQRWQKGAKWEETGIYEYMLHLIEKKGRSVDNCSNIEDIKSRYEKLDAIYEEVRRTKKLKTRKEIDPKIKNEEFGIYIHIGRNNQLIFGGGGCHRLAIAQNLKLKSIPAQLGVIHLDSIRTWKALKNKSFN